MEIPVLIEQEADGGYVATGASLGLTGEGDSAEEALQALQDSVRQRVERGARLVSLEVGAADNPWAALAGMYRDEPRFDEWRAATEEYRREREADPGAV